MNKKSVIYWTKPERRLAHDTSHRWSPTAPDSTGINLQTMADISCAILLEKPLSIGPSGYSEWMFRVPRLWKNHCTWSCTRRFHRQGKSLSFTRRESRSGYHSWWGQHGAIRIILRLEDINTQLRPCWIRANRGNTYMLRCSPTCEKMLFSNPWVLEAKTCRWEASLLSQVVNRSTTSSSHTHMILLHTEGWGNNFISITWH